MCLAVPAKVVSIKDEIANCQVGESETYIEASLMLMDDPIEIGDYIIIHAGFALRKLDVEEAEETLRILKELVKAADEQLPGAIGEDISLKYQS